MWTEWKVLQIIREERRINKKPGIFGGKFECFPENDQDEADAGDGGAGRCGGAVAVRRGLGAEHAARRQPGGAAQSGTFTKRLHSDIIVQYISD